MRIRSNLSQNCVETSAEHDLEEAGAAAALLEHPVANATFQVLKSNYYLMSYNQPAHLLRPELSLRAGLQVFEHFSGPLRTQPLHLSCFSQRISSPGARTHVGPFDFSFWA